MIEYRQLETETYQCLYLNGPTSPWKSLEEWTEDIIRRLDEWYQKALSFAPEQKLEFRDIQLYFLKCRIHRPTPLNRDPSPASRLVTIDCARLLAEQYTNHRFRGRLFYPWHAGHILFEAGIVLLDAALSSAYWLGSHVELQGVIEIIANYPSTLGKVSELWPALQVCVQTLTDLSLPVLNYLREVQTQQYLELDAPDRPLCPELNRYLFPAPALEDIHMRQHSGDIPF